MLYLLDSFGNSISVSLCLGVHKELDENVYSGSSQPGRSSALMQISVSGSGRRPPKEAGSAHRLPPALLSLKRGALPLKQSNQEPRWVRWVGRRAAPAQKTRLTRDLESLMPSALSQCLSRCGRGSHRRELEET